VSSLAISAYYYSVYDTVEVHSTVVDDDGVPVAPADLLFVKTELRKGDVILGETDELSKFYANEDFSFRAHFAHPPSTTGLEVEVIAVSRDGSETWRRRAPVVRGQVEFAESDFGDNAQNILDSGTGITSEDE
jgi:hypothetical protein